MNVRDIGTTKTRIQRLLAEAFENAGATYEVSASDEIKLLKRYRELGDVGERVMLDNLVSEVAEIKKMLQEILDR